MKGISDFEEADMIMIDLGWLLAIVFFAVIVGIFVGAALVRPHDRERRYSR